jgi:hypothetical protein
MIAQLAKKAYWMSCKKCFHCFLSAKSLNKLNIFPVFEIYGHVCKEYNADKGSINIDGTLIPMNSESCYSTKDALKRLRKYN